MVSMKDEAGSTGLALVSLNNFIQVVCRVVWYLALGCFGQGNTGPAYRAGRSGGGLEIGLSLLMEGTLPGQAFTSLGTGQPWRAVSSGSAMPQDVKALEIQ